MNASFMLGFFLFTATLLQSTPAMGSTPIADDMRCEQAIAHYQKHKKIYVVASGNDVVPIFGHKPASEWQDLRCSRSSTVRFFWVDTLDNKRCVIAAYCQ